MMHSGEPPPHLWIDNHCHIGFDGDGGEEIKEALAAGVKKFINVGTDLTTSHKAVAVAEAFPKIVFATAGIHPHEASQGLSGIAELLDRPEIIAVGECGLDYHYNHSPPEIQRKIFAEQIALAHEHNLPLVIHAREAWNEIFAILETESAPSKTVFHCFTGGPNEAEKALSIGALLSFSGIITFKNAQETRDAMLLVPLNQLMVETDSPYLAPVPLRGQKNSPKNLPLIAAHIAKERGLALETVSEQVWATTHDFYGIAPE
jgi:TatD DNase family protein